MQGESRHGPTSSQANDDGRQGAANSHQDLEASENQLFENSLLYNFSAGSLESLLYSSQLSADGATQDGGIPASCSYMVASPEAFSDSETYLNRYSDVLWNMDEEDDRFNGSKHNVCRNDRRSY